MLDDIQAVVQLVMSGGLLYGAVIVFQYWARTVPVGCDSDFEFAHHQRDAG